VLQTAGQGGLGCRSVQCRLDLKLTKAPPAPTDSYFLRAETFYNVASVIERPEDPKAFDLESFDGQSLHDRSHGEAFLALIAAMHQLVAKGSQFIIATHSPILLADLGATIYLFGTHLPRRVQFRDTEHYQVTRAFLEHPDRMLRELTAGDGIDPD
jgi:predicted ATPase